jgi:hypothetical protein
MGKLATAIAAIGIAAFTGAQTTADERPFSAQDVMSVCVAVAHDPKLASAILGSQGWSLVAREDYGSVREDLAIAYIGTSYVAPRPVHGTAEGIELWKEAWPVVLSSIDERLAREDITIYAHQVSGAVLLTEPPWARTTTGLSCVLAVPSSELGRSSYFPKLKGPTAPAVSLSHIETFFSDIVRSKIIITSAALNSKSIGEALTISTDIGAAFSSRVSHPVWALKP